MSIDLSATSATRLALGILNKSQAQAVAHHKGALLVTACAGSGKTRIITTRIAYLISELGVEASAIVALTFTNKAAREMSERVELLLGGSQHMPFIGTFHGYCVRLLRQHGHLLDTPFFTILDEDDRKKIIQGILLRNNLQKQLSARTVIYAISQAKNSADCAAAIAECSHPMMEEIYHAYETEKRASKCFDFDDLLLEGQRLFEQHPGFKKQFHETVQHVLVDEYQDTNLTQHALLKYMTTHNNKMVVDSVCVVGDEDQSIYSWRGATVANIMGFTKDFPKTTTVTVDQNYRSVQPILDLANAVISQNGSRNPKTIWSGKEGKDRIRLLSCASEYQEAIALAHYGAAALLKKQSIGILYRTHAQSRAIEEALVRNSIPYRVVGGVQFYARKEVKDVLAHLRLLTNPFDRPALFRIINTPTRGLGPKFETELHAAWQAEPFLTFHQALQKLIDAGAVKGTKKESVAQFLKIFTNLEAGQSPSSIADQVIAHTGYLQHLRDTYEPEESQSRIDNIRELLDAMRYFEATRSHSLQSFLEEVALMQEHQTAADGPGNESVTLMTMHAAKGLEFDYVAIAGLEENILPSTRSLDDPASLEEERRLLYVGITRSRERLLLSHANYRYTYGTMTRQQASRFTEEMPAKLAVAEDASYWNDIQLVCYLADWTGAGARPITSHRTFSKQKPMPKPATRNTKKTYFKSTAKPVQKKIVRPVSATSSQWKKNHPVKHATYGIGIIQGTVLAAGRTFVMIKFRDQVRKIAAQHLTPA